MDPPPSQDPAQPSASEQRPSLRISPPQLSASIASTMEGAKQGLQILSTGLNAAPIPEPFKSAVTAIPDIALQIITIVAAVKGNVEDAVGLAVYIANVTKTTMRPFEDKLRGSLDKSPTMKMRIVEFRGVLELVKEEITSLTSRRLRDRVFNYERDALKIGAMKKRVDDAIGLVQLETIVAMGYEVDLLSQGQERILEQQRLASQEQRAAAQRQEENQKFLIQQQSLLSQQPSMSTQEKEDADIGFLIRRLGDGDSGAAKKQPCLDGTREPVLERIARWIEQPKNISKRCFLLVGPAGSGKSAVASTLAHQGKESGRLGAGFFFRRDEQERNKRAILVIACQLASWGDQRVRWEIASAMRGEPDMAQRAPEIQFQKLIQEPLQILDSTSQPLIIILDALDECNYQFASSLLRLVGKWLATYPAQIKIFITSRGESHLQRFYYSEPMNSQLQSYSLADENKQSVEKDIGAYFRETLPELVGQWVAEPSNWPGDERRKALVEKAQGLFLWATTAGGILGDPNVRDPEKQLERLLASDRNIHLDELYAGILDRACPQTVDADLLALFRTVLGTLLVARIPINTHILASLLCPEDLPYQAFAERIRVAVLAYLQAVLIVPTINTSEAALDAGPIRFVHTSFIDYVTDKSRCDPRFLLDPDEEHEKMTIGCLRRIQDLRRNICDLQPSSLNSEILDLKQRIQAHMPPVSQYACTQVAAHVSATPRGSVVVHGLLEDFAQTKLLHWLEGLSLLGRTQEAVGMIVLMESWLKTPSLSPSLLPPTHSREFLRRQPSSSHSEHASSASMAVQSPSRRKRLAEGVLRIIRSRSSTHTSIASDARTLTLALLYDLRRFVMEFRNPITESSLHVYYSALPFAPSNTALSRIYGHFAEDGVKVLRGRPTQWSQTLWTASKHSDQIRCVAISPDRKTIVSGSQDRTLHLWDVTTGAPVGQAMKRHVGAVICLAVFPDSRTIVSGSQDRTLRLWDATTGAPIGEAMRGHSSQVNCVAVSLDGKIIVSGSTDNTLCRWDAATGAPIGDALVGHEGTVNCVAVSHDSKTIVSASDDCTLRQWDATTGATIGDVMEGHDGAINCFAVYPDERMIVSGSDDHTLRRWHNNTGRPVGKALIGHTNFVSCLVVSPDSKTIVSGSYDHTLRLWDAITGATIREMRGHTQTIRCLAVSCDGRTIVSGSGDHTLRQWEATTGTAIGKALTGHEGTVSCLAMSPDGKSVVSGSYDYTIRLWDTIVDSAVEEATKVHDGTVTCLAVSSDRKTIVSGSNDCTLRRWDIETGAPIGKTLTGQGGVFNCLAIARDGRTIVSGSRDGVLLQWDVVSGASIGRVLGRHAEAITCLAVFPDQKTIASGSEDGSLRLWNVTSGAPVGKAMRGDSVPVLCIAVSPDGEHIVSGSENRTLRRWRSATGALDGETLDSGPVKSKTFDFSPDGGFIVSQNPSASGGKMIDVWDAVSLRNVSYQRDAVMDVVKDVDANTILPCTFVPIENGWVLQPKTRKTMFWLPPGLRGEMVLQGDVIVPGTDRGTIFS
ncbi:hypothetical protein FRB96_008437 [Tulasnella sp. 330]|nr:hypothetical protein FRB96_008437 [Tulasnella sp. 330]